MVLSAALLVLVQSSIGMAVNLYVTVPAHHSGAHPSDYLSGSVQSVPGRWRTVPWLWPFTPPLVWCWR